MQIERRPLAGILLSLAGDTTSSLRHDENGIHVLGRRPRQLTYADIAEPLNVTKGYLGAVVRVPSSGADSPMLSGINHARAAAFVSSANDAWQRFHLDLVQRQKGSIDFVVDAISCIARADHYPAACITEPVLRDAATLASSLLKRLPHAALPDDFRQKAELIIAFADDPVRFRERSIEAFVEKELVAMAPFFDAIEKNPLTAEQRLSVVVDEDATLVLAGAGSGKTSVITAKAAYLMEKGIRKPDEILLVAFAKDAAEEMSVRIEERCGQPVPVRTFHALAYGIIGEVEGAKPALAPHATDDAAFGALVRSILLDVSTGVPGAASLLVRWFSEFSKVYRSMWDFENLHEYYLYVESQDLRTLQGELVKSFEELEIANWLYLNGIAYEYEPDYEFETSTGGRRRYTPDFRLNESGIYIEHFGVRKAKSEDGHEYLMTAPHVDREEYLAGMEWKRAVHAEHGTVLIETFSWERTEGRLLESLAQKLEQHVELRPIEPEKFFERLQELGQIDPFTMLIGTFLRHFKSIGYTLPEAEERSDRLKMGPRGRAFLQIFELVYNEYQARLGSRIDFEDMILRATLLVEEGRYRSPFRHLLVDEFQDISVGRARLLKALMRQHSDARIFAVGDDWQSIYRFAGSDIHLMRNFQTEFGGTFAGTQGVHRTVDLGRTFRSVDKIARAARAFVLKNPSQIEKQVIALTSTDEAVVRVAWVAKADEGKALHKVLTDISERSPQDGHTTSVMLLGRYRYIQPDNLPTLQTAFRNLSISFKTVHASKGLEADHVVVLRANRGRNGFPSEIVDDPILTIVLPDSETYAHAEERRVFYVALTRARKTVTLLASRSQASAFVTELLEDEAYGAVSLSGGSAEAHRCLSCGGRMVPMVTDAGRKRFMCEHFRLCHTSMPACPLCGDDMPVPDPATGQSLCRCGAVLPKCSACSDGWLVERTGPYGSFLGCVSFPRCSGKQRISPPRTFVAETVLPPHSL
jgi:DNA helicase-4